MPKIILNIPYLYNTVTWFCPFGVRVKEVWLLAEANTVETVVLL